MYYTKDEDADFYRLATLDYNKDIQYYEKIETELCFYKTIKACLKS
jgi:hypothetical protein